MVNLLDSKPTRSIRKTDSGKKTPPPQPGDQSLCGTVETHTGAHPVTANY